MIGRKKYQSKNSDAEASSSNQSVQKTDNKTVKEKKKYITVHHSGIVLINPPKFLKKLALFFKRHRLFAKISTFSLVLLIVFTIFFDSFNQYFKEIQYQISPKADALLIKDNSYLLGYKLNYDSQTTSYRYNQDFNPNYGEVAGQISGPRFVADFKEDPRLGKEITDPVTNSTISIIPKYALHNPRKENNRLIYPIPGQNSAKVITLGISGMKEDIVLEDFIRDQMSYEYELKLPEHLEAKIEKNGSIGIYGPESALLGNVSVGTENDKELLDKARKNGPKKTLIFSIPTPYTKETGKKTPTYNASFELEGNKLTLIANDLRNMQYPISIDPTIYIESAAKLMRGNNETNIDFDVDNELIQKSQTTGARIDAWQGNLDMSEGIWDASTAAAGGYIYRSGGRTGLSKPRIVGQQSTNQSSNSTSFTMNMPATRPAGDLYIALMCHDGTITVTPPAGWNEYDDTREHAAYWKIGTDEGGGNEASNYTFTGSGSEAWYGVIIRVVGFNDLDPVSGSPGSGSSSGNTVPTFPATTPSNDATLVIRSVGADNDTPSSTGWVPSGHTKIDSGNSGGQSCGFAAATLDTPVAASVSTGTATFTDNSINDTWGAASIAINPVGTPVPPQVEDVETSLQSSNSTSFTMNMPATRPAGDLYIAIMCHDGTGTVNPPSGGGWTEYSDVREYASYWKIGTDEGGGNEAASYTWTGGNEIWAGAIMRITGFDDTDPVSGTPSSGSSGGNSIPVFPAVTPDESNTLVIRAAGADNDTPSATGWVPTGHTKIASGTPNVANDCGYVAASLDSAPAAGISTGTATLGDGSLNDTWGASSIAINAEPVSSTGGETVRATLDWAKFNSSSLAIESPNPGTGACSGWCNDSTYNLPSARRGHNMIAYNGYLYVIGGIDSGGNRVSTVFIAKLGANGEPSLWHPNDPNKDNWSYWYTDTGLSSGTAKSYFGAVAYNNRMYILGGQTNASPGGVTTVEFADILPNGRLGSWSNSGMQSLPAGAGTHMQGVHIYNNVIYTIGGFEGAQTSTANLRNSVYYSRLNNNGTMNAWQSTEAFTTARSNFGGSFTQIWGAYIYLGGGCSAVNGSGYCTSISGDMQLASINADGSLDLWRDLGDLDNSRIGYSLIGWQGGLYRLGGCTAQSSVNGICGSTLADVDYGVINPAGEVSTVNITETNGVAPCSGGTPRNCDLPPTGDGAGQGGQMLSATTILNGYLYVIGGCTNFACSQSSGNTSYVSVGSDGSLESPSVCSGTRYGAWCVDSTNKVNGNDGVSAAGIATFNNRIYIVGGIDETATGSQDIYYNTTNLDGSLGGSWSNVTFGAAGISGELGYTYSFARANPSAAGSVPGNLFIIGGCNALSASAGCANSYNTEVYKCNINTTGSVSGCTTSGQLQLDVELSTETNQGLGLHSGTVYANYIYLIGGFSDNVGDRDTVFYAKIDDNNNIVDVESGTANPADNDDDWIESSNTLSVGRRRGWAFGYNGHIYAIGGYDDSGTGIIPFIEWSKMNVSDGAIDPFVTSSVTINQRWGLSMAVSNSFAYVIGGCDVGASPGGCSSFEPSIQTFQLYNNNSGSVADFTAQSDQTFTTDTNRWGASSVIHDGYIYVAGGCISATDCTNATNSVQYAPINDDNGSIGTWLAGGNLPADRAWGSLQVAGDTLYYIGGQNDTATNEQSTVYYTTSIISGNPTWSGSAASNGLPAARTKFGATVWNDRIYVVGGLNGSAAVTNTVYVSPQLSSGGNLTSAWSSSTTFDVARTGGAVTAYANNLYLIGGYDGSNYLSDVQFTQINADGTVDPWTFTSSLQGPLRDAVAVSSNGYIYVVNGRSSNTVCSPKVIIAPISANTTIATGNNPTGVGEWFETNVRYTGDRYGAAVAYDRGKIYTMGGGCTSPLSTNRHYESTVNSQPQIAIYSRMIDTDTDVFPNSWLMNGLDNSIGARWQVRYRTMNNTDGIPANCGTADMTTWGQDYDFGDVTLGDVSPYVARDGSGTDIGCGRYFYFFVSIDASKTFGYPEDVNRGPTIADLSLFFTSDPNKRLRHGKTFTGGEQQPLDTPCRQSEDADCPLP